MLDVITEGATRMDADTADMSALVRHHSDRFEANFAAGDAARLVDDYYTDDPHIIAPGAPMMTGRDAARAMFAALVISYSGCKLRQHDILQSGDLAVELGDAILTPKDPAQAQLESRYMIIWKRIGGRWAVQIDFFAEGLLTLDSAPPQ